MNRILTRFHRNQIALAVAITGAVSGLTGGVMAQGTKKTALTIIITGIKSHKGYLRIGLYDDAKKFTHVGEQVGYREIVLKNLPAGTIGPQTVVMAGVNPGRYAVACFEDANGNGRMDKNFIGIPTEAIGASNNPRPKLRTPRFSEAAFTLNDGENKQIAIEIYHM